MCNRWRGNWSELDTAHWTPSFQKALDYNPEDAANFDNGEHVLSKTTQNHLFVLQFADRAEVSCSEHSQTVHGLTLGCHLLTEVTHQTLHLRHTTPVQSVIRHIVMAKPGRE